jgi:RNA polymerase sigma-70 factor (ECF subfamily)
VYLHERRRRLVAVKRRRLVLGASEDPQGGRNKRSQHPDNAVADLKNDAQLIHAARHDPDAFGELYRRHVDAVHRFLSSRAPQHVAGELTAETFAQAALSLRRFRDEADGSALPWIYGIARNLLRRYHERERVDTRARERLGMQLRAYELDLDAANARLDAERAAPALAAALDSLPRGQRQALELRVVYDLPYQQVARSLECSEVAARIRVTRALGALARVLKGAH